MCAIQLIFIETRLFNCRGKDVLNQKSELQRVFQKQRENSLRKQLESQREDSHKDDPRTVLQRAIEQRAKHIKLMVCFNYFPF